MNIQLVAGGTRSGKSHYAQQCAEQSDSNLVFVATAEAADQEMAERIKQHQQKRDRRWSLIEEPFQLAAVVKQARESDCLLIDCLTLWVSNWLCKVDHQGWQAEKEAFLSALKNTQAKIILVTNEVGMGIVPMGELSRQFVDESGALHQAVADIADQVTWVMFGIPQRIKPCH